VPDRGHQPHEVYNVPTAAIFENISKQLRIINKLMGEQVMFFAIFYRRQDVKAHLLKRQTSPH